jgi:DNA-binding beta-propeller fold protein YncE
MDLDIGRTKMPPIKSVILLSILSLTPALSFAAEELPADKLVLQAEIQRGGDFIGFGFNSLWMMSGDRLARVNAADNSVIDIDLNSRGRYQAPGIGEGAVWVPSTGKKMILKVDPIINKLVQEIPAQILTNEGSIGVGEGGVWVVTRAGADTKLTRFNPRSGAVDANIQMPALSAGVVVDFGSVWVTGYSNGELYRIDPKINAVVATIKLHSSPRFIASGEGSIWVLNQGDGSVQRIDGKTGELLATIETGLQGYGGDIACGGGYVWVSMPGTPVAQIDPKANTLVRKFKGGGFGDAIRFGAGSLWVSGSTIHRIEPPQ